MFKHAIPTLILMGLAATSIAAAPAPAASAHEINYSISSDVGLNIDEGGARAGLIAPTGSISVRWDRKPSAAGTYSAAIKRTGTNRITYASELSAAGKARLVKAVRATKQRLRTKRYLVDLDAVARQWAVSAAA